MSESSESPKEIIPKTEQDFLNAKRDMEQKGFWMRPLVALEEKLQYNEELNKVSLRTHAYSYHRNITTEFQNDIVEAYKHKQNFVCGAFTNAGAGKTLLMLSVADKSRSILEKVKNLQKVSIVTAIGKEDTKNVINTKLVENSIFFEDEDPFTSGTDSITTEHSIINVQEVVLRFNGITYLTAAVTKKRMTKNFYACILEPIMRNDSDRKTLCKVYSGRTFLPLGYIVVNLLDSDHPLVLAHSIKEQNYKTKMLRSGGLESISITPQELELKSAKLLKYVIRLISKDFGSDGDITLTLDKFNDVQKRKIRKISIERIKTAMSKLAYEIPGSSFQHKRIIDETWDKIMGFKIDIDTENELRDEQEKIDRENQKEQEKIQESLQKELELQQVAQEQKILIKNIIPDVISELELDIENEKPASNLLKRHFFTQKGVIKDYLNYALAELEYNLLVKQISIQEQSQEAIEKFVVPDNDKFEFHEELYLEKLRISTEKFKKRMKTSWNILVDIYLDKQGGLLTDQLTKKYDLSAGSIQNYFKIIKGKIADQIGLEYEHFRYQQFKALFPDSIIMLAKSNSKEPDITVKHPDSIDYYSLKVRKLTQSKSTEVLILIESFRPELTACKSALETHKTSRLFIDFYNVYNHTTSVSEVTVADVTNKSRVLLKYTGQIEIKY